VSTLERKGRVEKEICEGFCGFAVIPQKREKEGGYETEHLPPFLRKQESRKRMKSEN